mmetsp:Transcript_73725/g.205914  ORF Transcript_73725/g.205914 Transcript_73725/m.205914 type:complete len:214 (-) Transcript_73725:17-658(-)
MHMSVAASHEHEVLHRGRLFRLFSKPLRLGLGQTQSQALCERCRCHSLVVATEDEPRQVKHVLDTVCLAPAGMATCARVPTKGHVDLVVALELQDRPQLAHAPHAVEQPHLARAILGARPQDAAHAVAEQRPEDGQLRAERRPGLGQDAPQPPATERRPCRQDTRADEIRPAAIACGQKSCKADSRYHCNPSGRRQQSCHRSPKASEHLKNVA